MPVSGAKRPLVRAFSSQRVARMRARRQAPWAPVCVKKTRQNKRLEPRSDSIGTEKALAHRVQVRKNYINIFNYVRVRNFVPNGAPFSLQIIALEANKQNLAVS